jgi:hypothetical protein
MPYPEVFSFTFTVIRKPLKGATKQKGHKRGKVVFSRHPLPE